MPNLDARINSYLGATTIPKPKHEKIVAVRPNVVPCFDPKHWREIGQVFLLNGYNGVYLMKGW
jgi:hypothetical protein